MLVSIEGMDGVGKTTISKNVSAKLNLTFIEKPLKRLLLIDREQSKEITENLYNNYSTNMQALYYLMGFLSVLEDSKKTDLLLDRGFLSTYYFSYDKENSFLFDMFACKYGFPDITIVLYASVDKRISRIKSRNKNDKDLEKERLYLEGYDRYFEAIKKYDIPYLIIDTENLSLDETTNLVSHIIKLLLTNMENFNAIREIFSIENFHNLSQYSFSELSEKIESAITSNQKIKLVDGGM